MHIVTIETPQLGNRTYLAHDGEHALVVDPPRDIARVEAAAEEAGVLVSAVAETHIHNDYVSGGRPLAARHGADHLVAADEAVRFRRRSVRDGDQVHVGTLQIDVLATPGHTPGHMAYLANTVAGWDTPGATPGLFSGGSLLFGTVGRTDLSGDDHTEPLARAQVRSARRLAELLPPETLLLPTHGFGSFCASTTTETGPSSTLALEVGRNPVLDGRDVESVVRALLDNYGPVPAYYDHMAELNLDQDLSSVRTPSRLTHDGVRTALRAGVPVVDLRHRRAFAQRHLEGVTNIEYGAQCATYVGWLLPWGRPLVLVGDDERTVENAVVDLARIGIDTVAGVSTEPAPEHAPETGTGCGYRRLRWDALAEELRAGRRPLVIDVRSETEFAEGHVEGAVNAPVHELPRLLETLPAGEAWVHCKSGYRAGIAASILHAAGSTVAHVDDDWDRATAAGIPTSTLSNPEKPLQALLTKTHI